MVEVAERVSRLEDALEEFIRTVGIEFSKLYNSQMRTEAELRAFKEEMRAFKEEMKAFKDEMNKRVGDLARRLGTVVEDVVAPGIPYAIRKTFGLEVVDLSLRRRKRLRGREREYDVIAVAGDYVFVIDVKSRYRREYLDEFAEMLSDFPEYFPEYEGLKLVPVIASFNFADDVIRLATRRRWLVVQLGGEYLEFVNKDEVGLP